MIINANKEEELKYIHNTIANSSIKEDYEQSSNKFLSLDTIIDNDADPEFRGKTLKQVMEELNTDDRLLALMTAYFGRGAEYLNKDLSLMDQETHKKLNVLFGHTPLGALFNLRMFYSTILDYFLNSNSSPLVSTTYDKNSDIKIVVRLYPKTEEFERNNFILTKLFTLVVDWHSDYRLFMFDFKLDKLFGLLFKVEIEETQYGRTRTRVIRDPQRAYELVRYSKIHNAFYIPRNVIANNSLYEGKNFLAGPSAMA